MTENTALNAGEQYAGVILGEGDMPSHHLILLPGMLAPATWSDAAAWANHAGGSLPDRREQSLLFANLRDAFEYAGYWSGELSGHHDRVWAQIFRLGGQYCENVDNALHAVAVRRIPVRADHEPHPADHVREIAEMVAEAKPVEADGWQIVPKVPTEAMAKAYLNPSMASWGQRYTAMLAAAPQQPAIFYSHKWDRDGERCEKCGDKDWMGGSCSAPAAHPQNELIQVADRQLSAAYQSGMDGDEFDMLAAKQAIQDAAPQQPAPAIGADATLPAADKRICWSADNESFNSDSLDELLDSNDHLVPGDVIHYGEAIPPEPHHICDADDIIETMRDRADDIAGEHADGFPNVSKEASDELNDLLAGWINRHCTINFFTVENVKPYTLTDADFENDAAIALQAGEA